MSNTINENLWTMEICEVIDGRDREAAHCEFILKRKMSP